MRILFDQGTPVPLRRELTDHEVATVFELGWSNLKNGDLLREAEASFDVLVTTDQSLPHQQNLTGMNLAVLILPTTNWPLLRSIIPRIVQALEGIRTGEVVRIPLSQ